MNSRERVRCALNHQQPDRVPIDLGGTRQSGIAASTYHTLKKKLGVHSPTRVFDLYQMLAEVERPIMERFGARRRRPVSPRSGVRDPQRRLEPTGDCLTVRRWKCRAGFQPQQQPDGGLVILRGEEPIASMPKDGFYFDRLEKYPGATHVDLDGYQPPLLSAAELSSTIGSNPKPSMKTPTLPSSRRWGRPTSCFTAWERAISSPG